jgi:cytochrome c-type biogenesis protein CcmH/NrfF
MRRREFLGLGAGLWWLQAADRLPQPSAAGQPRAPVGSGENDPAVQALERRLKCTCGCNLDIYTCRTTDFTCTYSPQLHAEVLALRDGGADPDQIVEAFVAKYGEQILMAPPPAGFNLAGYLVPGLALLVGGGLLAAVLLRRARSGESATAPAATAGAG